MKVKRLVHWKFLGSLAGLSLLAAAMMHCGNVPLTAPSGAELSITANPTDIPAYNGVSTITVVGFESTESGDGGPLPNGTQIFFTTNVGLIEERVEMQNGRALAYLRSNGRAGVATVTARSGGGVTAPTVDVNVGNTEGINIVLTANPATVTPPDFTTEITATVFDNNNNPLEAVPLVFQTNAGSLASAGSTLRTNAQGKAVDRLTLEDETSATVTVFSGSVSASLTIGRGAGVDPIVNSVFPSVGAPGETLNVTITGLNFQPGATVSFGQGVGINSVAFVSSTLLQVNISIDPSATAGSTAGRRTVTVTNPDGGSGSLADAFLVGGEGPRITSISPSSSASRDIPIAMTITGTNFQPGAIVQFTPQSGASGLVIVAGPVVVSDTQIDITIRVESAVVPAATTKVYDVTVVNPDNTEDTQPGGFTAI
jgi:hypothetical protein